MTTNYDVIIIGAGPGGYVAAIRAAQLGMKTALIEKRETLGGTCLNVGCIPSKALLESSHHYSFLKNHAQEHGISTDKLSLSFSTMRARKDRIVKGLVDSLAALIKRNQIDWILGTASFKDEHRISIYDTHSGKENREIEGKKIIIATGSEPISLPFLPFDEKKVLSSTGALNLSQIPPRLAVIGAGVIGVELASVYSRLGAKVELIEMLDHICLGIDQTMGKMFLKILQKQGMKFHLSSKVTKADVGTSIQLAIESSGKTENMEVDAVLVSVGRKPYTDELNLKQAGVNIATNGLIPIDDHFRTNVPHIFAIGDVIEGPQLAHRASEEGIAVIEFLARIFHKISSGDERDVGADSFTIAREYYPTDKARAIGNENGPTDRSSPPRVCEKSGLARISPKTSSKGDLTDCSDSSKECEKSELASQTIHVNYLAIPSVVYTSPELASVGFTEEEAKEKGFSLLMGSYLFRGNARAHCMGEEEGMVKIIGDQKSGRLLGMHILGTHASEMIGEGVIAIEKEMTVAELAYASHAHPTLCEAIKEAALNALGLAIHL